MKILTSLGIFLIAATTAYAASFKAPAGSPLARNEHPRIFVTRSDLPKLRAKIQTYYASDFGTFLKEMEGLYSVSPGSGPLGEWNEIFGAARSFAFLHLIDPQSLGFTSTYSARQYGEKALELALYIANSLPDSWTEAHHGVKNLTTAKGGVASLALQVVYDWTHDISTVEQRRKIADRLMAMWDNKYDSNKVKLENHYAANAHVYAGALCFYGDADLGSSYTNKSQIMMDSYLDVFLTRQLATAEALFEGSSDWVEGDSYSMDGYVGLMMLAAASSSALGENFFATNTWIRYAPYYIYFNMMPMPYKGDYYFAQQNTSSVMEVNGRAASAVMNMAAAMLAEEDPDLAGFCAWFVHDSPYGQEVNEFKYYDPYLFDVFYKFLFGTRHVRRLSPEEAEVPLSFHLGQMHVMRSDHGFNDATLIQFFSPMYWYSNGHNEPEQGAINIHRFGSLAVGAANSKNSGSGIPRVSSGGKGFAQNNVLGLGPDKELDVEMGGLGDTADTPEYFQIGEDHHIGTVDAREYRPGLFDYVNYDYTRSYKDGSKADLARRAVVYLRGPVNHEYVVVMDRVQSSQQKFFLLHTPADLEAVGGAWQAAGAGHWTTSARTLKVVNRIDQSHGQMYVTSLFPETVEVHKFGGPGKEWVWADGTPLNYDAADFSEKAAYLLSDHTLQFRSQEGQFLTVMQIGDANTMGAMASVRKLSGDHWIGTLIDDERLVIFSKPQAQMSELTYQITSNKRVKHLIVEMKPWHFYTVTRNGKVVAQSKTGSNGVISFSDSPGGSATYSVALGGFTNVGQTEDAIIPEGIRLANFPNPFNPETTIYYAVPEGGKANLAIFNTRGQLIRTLLSDSVSPGEHSITWDGTDDSGAPVASGVYVYRIELNTKRRWNKLILAK